MRKGIVVATHPEDVSVDMVMVDDGSRLSGVQLLSKSASTRSGSIDLPAVPAKQNKWDITQLTGQDILAVIDMVGRTPMVVGFQYPQINQMLFADPLLKFERHQSDVISYTDGDGNFGIIHPSGAFVQVGENTTAPQFAGKNVDGTLLVDRNTDKAVSVTISLGGQAVVVHLNPNGTGDVTLTNALAITAPDINFKATNQMTFDTPKAHFTGEIDSDGDQVAEGISQVNHGHTKVKEGDDISGPPAAA